MFMLKLQEEKMKSPELRASPTMSNTRADFGAAIEILRLFSATYAFPERRNLACLVMSYLPEEFLDFKSCRRKGKCAHPEEASRMRSLSPSHLCVTRSQLPPLLHPPLPARRVTRHSPPSVSMPLAR